MTTKSKSPFLEGRNGNSNPITAARDVRETFDIGIRSVHNGPPRKRRYLHLVSDYGKVGKGKIIYLLILYPDPFPWSHSYENFSGF